MGVQSEGSDLMRGATHPWASAIFHSGTCGPDAAAIKRTTVSSPLLGARPSDVASGQQALAALPQCLLMEHGPIMMSPDTVVVGIALPYQDDTDA